MLITIDTDKITQPDLALLAFILRSADPSIDTDTVVGATPAAEPPKRGRRTKLEIAFDEALASFKALAHFDGENLGTGNELAALTEAHDALKAKDPGNYRLQGFVLPVAKDAEEPVDEDSGPDETLRPYGEEPNDPETDAPEGEPGVSIEELTELATELLSADKSALKALLEEFGIGRVKELPESEYARFADALRAKLKS